MPADPTVRVEYVVRSPGGSEYMPSNIADCRTLAAKFDARRSDGKRCRVIKRTITEEDVTDAE